MRATSTTSTSSDGRGREEFAVAARSGAAGARRRRRGRRCCSRRRGRQDPAGGRGPARDLRGGAEGALERVQRELGRREARRRRERRTSALIGLAVGAALARCWCRRAAPDTGGGGDLQKRHASGPAGRAEASRRAEQAGSRAGSFVPASAQGLRIPDRPWPSRRHLDSGARGRGGSVSTGARRESSSESMPGVHWIVSPG